MDLIILAAGESRRFGRLKQYEPIDENNNFIMDYSIYDAIKCGINKVIFIINEKHINLFQNTIQKRLKNIIKTEYVIQKNDNFGKPFGTGHAIICAKEKTTSNFIVVNADDFYGYESFSSASTFLKNNNINNNHAIVTYKLKNTILNSNAVNRGVCKIKDSKLVSIKESKIEKIEDRFFMTQLQQKDLTQKIVSADSEVALGIFAFKQHIFDNLEDEFNNFIKTQKGEFFLTSALSSLINKNKIELSAIKTNSKWCGMTYLEDKENFCKFIFDQKQLGLYPQNLWN